MARWIVFDGGTASELRRRLPHEAVFEAPGRAALEYALSHPKTVVAMLPLTTPGSSAIAVFRPAKPPTSAQRTSSPQPDSAPVRATGFLGLNDEFVLEDEQAAQEKKSLWRRLWKD